jgi:heme-degrading monooxygenase HmoA
MLHDFIEAFDEAAPAIRAHPGCQHLELWKDTTDAGVVTTYSIWQTADDLAAYKDTRLFDRTWRRVKPYFAGRPKAHSYKIIRRVS